MAKFYLHMQPGETLGKITKLKYIDDVSDDELIIYVFEDGSKSDEQYIAEINCMDAFNGRFVMVELTDPTNKWTFKTSEYNVAKSNVKVIDGVEYEIPDPGLSIRRDAQGNPITGEHVSITTSDEGTALPKTLASAGKRTDSIPPRVIKNKKVEDKENYLLSLHPELIDSSLPTKTPVNENNSVITSICSFKQSNPNVFTQQSVNSFQRNVMDQPTQPVQKQQSHAYNSPISTNVIETVKHATININVDDILSNKEFESVTLVYEGKPIELSIKEFTDRITNTPVVNEIQEHPVKQSPFDDPSYKEDILITNMIDKSKKKVYTIGVDVELELPPKEVYRTIKDVYPDGMAQHFVTSISRRMNNNTLKESLAAGLTAYYEATLMNQDAIANN